MLNPWQRERIDFRQELVSVPLRRSFGTVAGEALDQPAVNLVTGHTQHANDMGARYRQRIRDERLEKVADHVRKWLWAKATNVSPKDTVAKKKAPVKKAKQAGTV